MHSVFSDLLGLVSDRDVLVPGLARCSMNLWLVIGVQSLFCFPWPSMFPYRQLHARLAEVARNEISS